MSKLTDLLAGADDLGAWRAALAREQAIRDAMATTGEGREVVAEMLDALIAMDEEAVLDLAEGEPTTLADALARYRDSLNEIPEGEQIGVDGVINHLSAILAYPWSGEEALIQLHEPHQSVALDVARTEDRLEVHVGGSFVFSADVNDHSGPSLRALENASRAVYRTVLARVIADRDHHVQINGAELASLVQWATNSSGGSWSPDRGSRLSVDAVAGGGVLVRTRPYAYQRPGHAILRDEDRLFERARPISADQIKRALIEDGD